MPTLCTCYMYVYSCITPSASSRDHGRINDRSSGFQWPSPTSFQVLSQARKSFSNKAYCFGIHSSLVGMPIQSCGFGESVRRSAVVLLDWIKRRSDSVATRSLHSPRFMWEGASSPSCTHLLVTCVCLWPHYRLVPVLHKPPSIVHTTFKLLPTSLPILNLKYSSERNRIKCCYM